MEIALSEKDLKKLLVIMAEQGWLTKDCTYSIKIKPDDISFLLTDDKLITVLKIGDLQ